MKECQRKLYTSTKTAIFKTHVTKVAQPGFEGRRVVRLDLGTIRDDRRIARDRRPLPRAVEESQVDFGMGGQIIRLAGFGVGMEQKVDAIAFLCDTGAFSFDSPPDFFYDPCSSTTPHGRTLDANAMHLLASRPLGATVVIMQNLLLSMNWTSVLTFSFREGSSRFFAV